MTQAEYDKNFVAITIECAQKLMRQTKTDDKSLDEIQAEAKEFATKLLGPRPTA